MQMFSSPTLEQLLELNKEHLTLFGMEQNEEKITRLYNHFMSANGCIVLGDSEKYLAAMVTEHPFLNIVLAMENGFYARDRKGRELVKQYEEWAKEMGATRTVLTSYLPNDVSIYYKRLGYTLLEQSYTKELV